MSGNTSVSGLVIFFGLLGGIAAFGFIGLIIGPVVLVTTGSLLKMFARPDLAERSAVTARLIEPRFLELRETFKALTALEELRVAQDQLVEESLAHVFVCEDRARSLSEASGLAVQHGSADLAFEIRPRERAAVEVSGTRQRRGRSRW